jgi:hypothetical protein
MTALHAVTTKTPQKRAASGAGAVGAYIKRD